MSAPTIMEPSACTWCGIARRGHGRQYADAAEWHEWERPSQEQILARMKARRLQLAVARMGALPMPVGGERTLDVVEEELTGVNLALWEEVEAYARLRLALESARRGRRELRDRVAELEAQRDRRRVRLVALQNDALNMRGSLSPMGEDRKVPFPLGETLTPAVEWLISRVAELEAGPALPWAAAMDDGDLHLFLDDLVSAALNRWQSEPDVPDRVTLAEIEKACAGWRTPGQGFRSDEPEVSADALTRTFLPVASLREDEPAGVPCSKCGDPVHWVESTNSDGRFWRHNFVPGRFLDHFGEVAGAEGRHAFEKEYLGESDAKRRLARCKHCGQDRKAPMHAGSGEGS